MVHYFHELVERKVVALCPAPVVLYLYHELLVEGMVCERGERHVVVGIEAERLREFNRSVGFSLVFELLGQFAEVVVVDKAHVVGPYRRKFFLLALCEFFNHGSGHGAELLEIEQAVALERSGLGHGFLRCEAVVFHAVNHVVEAAAFGE